MSQYCQPQLEQYLNNKLSLVLVPTDRLGQQRKNSLPTNNFLTDLSKYSNSYDRIKFASS